MKIPDSPAAVSFITDKATLMPLTKVGKAPDPEVSQKTCKAYYFDGFEERPEENKRQFCLYILTPVHPVVVLVYLFLIILP
ncbi:hypothetical protein GCM10007084_28210 [Parabacteroides faecis]|nr:hypothetical protein GCM10007084_28210 [Parabacteroides faecis]